MTRIYTIEQGPVATETSRASNKLKILDKKYLLKGALIGLSAVAVTVILIILIYYLVVPSYFKSSAEKDTCNFKSKYSNFRSKLGVYNHFAVAADNFQCSTVGKKIFQDGGSAVDAAIAATICNGAAHPQSSGIGGGSFIVIFSKESGRTYAIDARESAPRNAHQNMFINSSSILGGLSTGIPGEIAGLWEAYKLGGKLPWNKLFEPTVRLCREGFSVTSLLERDIDVYEDDIRGSPEFSEIFINKNTNKTLRMNDIMKMPKLARTLEIIGNTNVSEFYNGQLSKIIVQEINENGGNVSMEDLNEYRALVKQAMRVKINSKYTVVTSPPPSSGILVTAILRIMKDFDLSKATLETEKEATLFYHRLIEVFKHIYFYRSLLADENIENVDDIIAKLQDEEFLQKIKAKIVDTRTFPSSYYGNQYGEDTPGTMHLSVLGNGDAVSVTSTINLRFGALYIGKTTGIIYNNDMDDFSTPNMVNAFGFVPSISNYIKPRKRPMSSMSPIIVLDQKNNVRLVLGASGGSRIISSVAQVAIKNLFIDSDIKKNIDDKRIHHQLYPENAEIDMGFNDNIRVDLKAIGHKIECTEIISKVQGITQLGPGRIEANTDYRAAGNSDGL